MSAKIDWSEKSWAEVWLILTIAAILIALVNLGCQTVWNGVLVEVVPGIKPVTYWQMFLLFGLCGALFKK